MPPPDSVACALGAARRQLDQTLWALPARTQAAAAAAGAPTDQAALRLCLEASSMLLRASQQLAERGGIEPGASSSADGGGGVDLGYVDAAARTAQLAATVLRASRGTALFP